MITEHEIRLSQATHFPSDPKPDHSLIIPITIGAAVLVAMGLAAWVFFG